MVCQNQAFIAATKENPGLDCGMGDTSASRPQGHPSESTKEAAETLVEGLGGLLRAQLSGEFFSPLVVHVVTS